MVPRSTPIFFPSIPVASVAHHPAEVTGGRPGAAVGVHALQGGAQGSELSLHGLVAAVEMEDLVQNRHPWAQSPAMTRAAPLRMSGMVAWPPRRMTGPSMMALRPSRVMTAPRRRSSATCRKRFS